ncbi:ATP-dependent dethiobiotin synthetase BioD [Halomicronema hongdechloris C2206]|uniref:ATP-dependent dethiobiotin synthetase BioD n=1 Tax=Halomicronema hongdechloris C2206 TaxID=1641165 RepID=A0A1Z3HIJ0_9CYAN|nr:dethiobiotin synthase [Halomicronema hongdechloris]ASC70139.1 ATP-dependent dethiobiotin synthetase BioD [Halomicronema hongdechloris C2206]
MHTLDRALLIAGSDTEVGKTVLTTALAAYWQQHRPQRRLGILKLVQAGVGDRELYQQLFDLDQSAEEIAPQWFAAPLAPPLAAAQECRQVNLTVVWQGLQQLLDSRDWVLVEALGGLGSPVTAELTVADLAAAWHLPVVLVVPVQLGAIAQSVANVALARQSQLSLQGIVLNCRHPCSEADQRAWAPIPLIESLTQVPVLGTLPYLDQPQHVSTLAQVAASLDLEVLLTSPRLP